jgi:16S rRNA (uracil1498-N3)-methyltransferase
MDYDAVITEPGSHQTRVEIKCCVPGVALPGPPVELALAMVRSDRFEWALQKATELGVDRVIPVSAERSVLSLQVGRDKPRYARWMKIAIEAAEQSGRSTVPLIDPVASFVDAVDTQGTAHVVVLWEDEGSVLLPTLTLDYTRPVRLVIGPEGGFTDEEVDVARRCGATTASLGPLMLRSETAAVAALAMLLSRKIARCQDTVLPQIPERRCP